MTPGRRGAFLVGLAVLATTGWALADGNAACEEGLPHPEVAIADLGELHGRSQAEVCSLLGFPDGVLGEGGRETWVFDDENLRLELHFADGFVSVVGGP